MAYEDNEVSVRGGKPNELYLFEGTYSTYRYTSGPRPVNYQAPGEDEEHEYTPIAIQRSAVNAGTQDDDKLDLTITIAVTHQIVMDYGFQDTPPSLQLSIFRYHDLSDVRPYWYGPVNNIQVTGGKASIRSYSKLGAALAQSFPNVFYQAPCNHTLYDARCGVSYAANSENVTVVEVAGRTITFDDIGAGMTGKLIGGEVKLPSGERRMITAQAANVVTVNFPFSTASIAEDDVVVIAKGCDLAYTGDCKLKFDNQLNFGGFPFIPAENPFTEGVDDGTLLDDGTCPPVPFTGPQTVFHYSQPDPCNPTFGATRALYFPMSQPNAPNGKIMGAFNGLPANGTSYIYEYDDYVNPLSAHYGDPAWSNCRGQKLVTFQMSNLDYMVTFHFLVPGGDWSLTVQYPAFFCGSVGKDHGIQNISMCRSNPPEFPNCLMTTVWEGEVVGNVPYFIDFSF